MANRPLIRIHNLETDEIIDREMNDEEYEAFIKEQESLKAESEAKAEAEAAKLLLLEKLGLTEDEAKLLLS